MREALAFACDHGDGERALMLAGTIWRFWWSRGQVDEASRWYERAFAVGDGASETARARGLFGAAHMAEARGDVAKAREQFQQAADGLRRIGATRWLILALAHLAGTFDSDPDQAQRIYREALALAEASGDVRGAAIVKANLAVHYSTQGDDRRGVVLLRGSTRGSSALGDVYGVATIFCQPCVSRVSPWRSRCRRRQPPREPPAQPLDSGHVDTLMDTRDRRSAGARAWRFARRRSTVRC